MKLDDFSAAKNEIQSRLDNTQLTLSDHRQQIIALGQQAQENFTRTVAKVDELGESISNVSEQVDHLYTMREDHSDQLSQINSNLANISTQFTHFNGSFNNLTSVVETQKIEVVSLASRMSTLNSRR